MSPDHKLAADYVEDTITGSFDLALDSFARLTPAAAKIASRMFADVPGFAVQATERGSLAARTRIALSALENGKRLTEAQVRSLAEGFGPAEDAQSLEAPNVEHRPAAPSRTSALVQHMEHATGRTTEAEASARLADLGKNPDWASKALERGTPEAVERLMLNAQAAGQQMSSEDATRLAAGALGG